jgi:very-short-patch-repair endonuclease
MNKNGHVNPFGTFAPVVTSPQQKLFDALRRQGIFVVKEWRVGHSSIDSAIPSCRLGIEVDGLAHATLLNRIHDTEKEQWLKRRGWRIIRFSNGQITEDLDSVIRVIRRVIN